MYQLKVSTDLPLVLTFETAEIQCILRALFRGGGQWAKQIFDKSLTFVNTNSLPPPEI